jgi:hypothetical protein
MKIEFEDKTYDVEVDALDLDEAMFIKVKFGFTLRGWQSALEESDPSALLALYWLMLKQNGTRVDPDRVNFKVVKFIEAFDQAQKAEPVKDETPTRQPRKGS